MNRPASQSPFPCPHCGSQDLQRSWRSSRMRLLPGSRRYLCNVCNRAFLRFLGMSFKLMK